MSKSVDSWDAKKDLELLTALTKENAEDAFRAAVERHASMVYATCLRRLTGDTHLAEDATQAVFIVLARKAKSIRRGTSLGAWLFKTANLVAANLKREEARRRRR